MRKVNKLIGALKVKIGVLITTLLLVLLLGSGTAVGVTRIHITYDSSNLFFHDVPPIIENGRVLVPMRELFEVLGAAVNYNDADRTIKATRDTNIISLQVNSGNALINDRTHVLDVPANIVRNRVMIPLRFVSEALGKEVEWDGARNTVNITSKASGELALYRAEVTIDENKVELGMTKDELTARFGQPQRVDYTDNSNMVQYIYNSNPANFFMAGVCHGRIVSIITAAKSFTIHDKSVGSLITVMSNVGDGSIRWLTDRNNVLWGVELTRGCYHQECDNEIKMNDRAKASLAYEKQIFDLTNAYRVSHGVAPLQWHEGVATVARSHSYEMATNDYLSHYNHSGQDPFDRLTANGISYRAAGENCAYYQNGKSWTVFLGWVRSSGHRENMLAPDWTHLGVGVAIAQNQRYPNHPGHYFFYATQNFITQR